MKYISLIFLAVLTGACDGSTDNDGGGGDSSTGGAGGSGGTSSGGGSGGEGDVCETTPYDKCPETPGCRLIGGHAYDEELECIAPESVLKGCVPVGCPSSPVLAEDPDGGKWSFIDGCIPSGWVQVGSVLPVTCAQGGAGGVGGSN